MTQQGYVVAPSDIDTYGRDGVVVLRGVLPKPWLDMLAAGVEENMLKPGPYGKDHAESGSAYFGDYVNWQRIPVYRDIASQGPLGAVAGQLMASSHVQLFHEHVLVKESGNSSPTPWHQDQPYYCVDGQQTVSMWVSMDPVIEAVCPRFLAVSHLGEKLFVPKRFKSGMALEGDTSEYAPFDGVDEDREAARLRYWALEPGDLVAFNFKTLHNAPPNPSRNRRRVVSFRFTGDDCRYAVRPHAVSPPFPEMGLTAEAGVRLPESWFPVVWNRAA